MAGFGWFWLLSGDSWAMNTISIPLFSSCTCNTFATFYTQCPWVTHVPKTNQLCSITNFLSMGWIAMILCNDTKHCNLDHLYNKRRGFESNSYISLKFHSSIVIIEGACPPNSSATSRLYLEVIFESNLHAYQCRLYACAWNQKVIDSHTHHYCYICVCIA